MFRVADLDGVIGDFLDLGDGSSFENERELSRRASKARKNRLNRHVQRAVEPSSSRCLSSRLS